MNLESCAITLNKCLVIGQKSSYKKGRFVLFRTSSLQESGLRSEMKIMPLG